MMKKNIYPAYNPASELIAIPFIINNVIRRKTIKARLNEVIESAKKETLNETLTEQEKYVKQIDYDDLDDFFANHFKALENSKAHSFDDKIDYCLDKYAKEAKSLLSATNTVVLEENFLKGAKKTLGLYFLLEKHDIESDRFGNCLNEIQNIEITPSTIEINKTLPNLCQSIKFKKLFINEILFNKINPFKLKEYNIFYKKTTEGLEFTDRSVSDLSLLLIILDDKKIIKLPTLKYINEILLEVIGKEVSTTTFSECKKKYLYPQIKDPSIFDLDAIKNINIFISEYLTKI